MSIFPLPASGKSHTQLQKAILAAASRLRQALRKIDDANERLDVHGREMFAAAKNSAFTRIQLRHILAAAFEGRLALAAYDELQRLFDNVGKPSPEEQAAILDAVDDVVLPSEGGEA